MRSLLKRYRWLSIGVALTALCVAWGAFSARQPAKAQDVVPPRVFTCIPAGLTQGQTSRHIFFLPAVQKVREAAFRLVVMDTHGKTLVNTDFQLAAGDSLTGDLVVLADGSVRFNGKALDLRVPRGQRLEIIAILIGLDLPSGVPLLASSQCVNNLRTDEKDSGGSGHLGRTTYILPYIEQDNFFQ